MNLKSVPKICEVRSEWRVDLDFGSELCLELDPYFELERRFDLDLELEGRGLTFSTNWLSSGIVGCVGLVGLLFFGFLDFRSWTSVFSLEGVKS